MRALITMAVLVGATLVAGCGGTADEAATGPAATDNDPVAGERPFLDGYSGQTLDGLLSMTDTYRVDSVVLAIEEALREKAPGELSSAERVVLAVEALEREVNNGGYHQFFLNEPSHAHETVAALREIDCPETARITESATAALGLRAGWTDDQVEAAAADMPDERLADLDSLDQEFYAYPEPIEDRLLAFIRANADKITL